MDFFGISTATDALSYFFNVDFSNLLFEKRLCNYFIRRIELPQEENQPYLEPCPQRKWY